MTETKNQLFTITRPSLILYTGFIALAAVSLFLAFTEAATAYTGYVWKYSTQYIYKTTLYAITMFIATLFLAQSSILLLRRHPYAYIPGIFGLIILAVFPAYLLAVDPEHAIPLAALIVPAILLIVLSLVIYKKQKLHTPPQ